jgi:hypothetical protein
MVVVVLRWIVHVTLTGRLAGGGTVGAVFNVDWNIVASHDADDTTRDKEERPAGSSDRKFFDHDDFLKNDGP